MNEPPEFQKRRTDGWTLERGLVWGERSKSGGPWESPRNSASMWVCPQAPWCLSQQYISWEATCAEPCTNKPSSLNDFVSLTCGLPSPQETWWNGVYLKILISKALSSSLWPVGPIKSSPISCKYLWIYVFSAPFSLHPMLSPGYKQSYRVLQGVCVNALKIYA